MLPTGPVICLGIPTYLRESVTIDTLDYVFVDTGCPEEIIVAHQTPEYEAFTAVPQALISTAHIAEESAADSTPSEQPRLWTATLFALNELWRSM